MHQCTECGAVAAEPRLRYCEECGARMPEFKPPPPRAPTQSAAGAEGELVEARRAGPAYTGPKWLEHVPAHSPTVLGVILHSLALWASILPSLAGVGPLWSFVMILGGVLMVAREYRASGERNPLVDWIPETLQPPFVPALYMALAVGISLPMLEFSIQPLLWWGGTALVLRDQWGKVFTSRGGYAEMFEPRAVVRGQRVLAFAGIVVCLLAFFFTWTLEGEVLTAAAGQLRSGDAVYGGAGGLRVSGFQLPVGPTIELGLLTILVLLMLRPEVERPVWLRFVPAGITVISLTWTLVNMRLKVGPIMFLAGLVPVGLVAALQALGRDEQPGGAYAEGAPPDESYPEDGDLPPEDDFATEDQAPPDEDEDQRG